MPDAFHTGRLRLAVLYVGLVAFWGSTFLWVEIALDSTGPFVISAVRLMVGALVVLLFIWLGGAARRAEHSWAALRPWAGRGMLLAFLSAAAPGVLLGFAQQEISSGTASIVNATAPLWTVAIGFALVRGRREGRVGGVALAGLLVGVVGVGVLVGQAPTASELKGELYVVVVAIVYSMGGVFAQRRFAAAPPYAAALFCTAGAALYSLPFGIGGLFQDPPTAGDLAAIVALGAMSSGLAYVIYFELIRELGATRTLTVTYLQPVVAILLGVIVLGESLRAAHLAGLALILLGVAAVNGQLPRRAAAALPAVPEVDPPRIEEEPCPAPR
jgi:drug/metabolite transporter (DMT)-like permease